MRAMPFAPSALACVAVLSAVLTSQLRSQSAGSTSAFSPPVAPIRLVTDKYFGTKITDPYRYMENLEDPEVQAWIKSQNDYTHAQLDRISGRQQLLARIREFDQSVPQIEASRMPGDLYLISKQLPGELVGKLYLRHGLDGEDKLLVDPEKIALAPSNQGKGQSEIRHYALSDDGKYLSVGVIPGGSEMNGEIHVLETATGRETGDVITRGVGAEQWYPYWLPDNRSFVYGRLQQLAPHARAAEVRQKFRSYVHVLGTTAEKDRSVFGYSVVPGIHVDPSLIASVRIAPGSRYALGVLNDSVSPNSAFYIAPADSIGKSNSMWRKVAEFSDGVTKIVIHDDDLYLLTYKDTPRYKIVRIDARKPELSSAEVIVPPGEAVITDISGAQDALYVQLLDGGVNRIQRIPYGLRPKVERVALPFEGTAFAITDLRLPGALLYVTSWIKAGRILAYDPQTKTVSDTKLQPGGAYDNPDNVESAEVKVPSHDGTLVPLSIIFPKGMKLDGSHPTLLNGYGGYGISMNPYFDPKTLAWFEKGGIRATCHVRGGGEYGEEWHLAGKGPTKPNTWRDFIACAEYLISKGYTSSARLAGQGGSAGGILIGRAITDRPDLFGAAIINVGLVDTLRFENTANGATNLPELGSTKTEEDFKALYAMSSFHHVKDSTAYPAVLLTTGINDPLVDPWEPAKMTARLQAATSSGKPVLLRVDYGGGHGGGSGAEQYRERLADSWSFLLWQFGMPEFQPQTR